MTSRRSNRTARIAGLVVGAGLAIVLIASGRPAAGGDAVGAEVSFYANQTGELAIAPTGPEDFLHERSLMPGGAATTGEFRMTNQTGEVLELRLSAVGSDAVLDDELVVDMTSGGQVLASGLLGDLAEPAETPLMVTPGETVTVEVSAALPGEAPAAAASLVEVAIGLDIADAEPGG